MTPAELRTAWDALGVSAQFVAERAGVGVSLVWRHAAVDRGELPVTDRIGDAVRDMLNDWDAAADRLTTELRDTDADSISRHVELDAFYAYAPELRGWGVKAQGLLLAEIQRRLQLPIEYVS